MYKKLVFMLHNNFIILTHVHARGLIEVVIFEESAFFQLFFFCIRREAAYKMHHATCSLHCNEFLKKYILMKINR